jgi:MerR family transcriptional regulator, light-induced transcriptional regulator
MEGDGTTQRLDAGRRPPLSISAAAAETGISPATLRVWQTRYGLMPSRTTSGGHRRYSRADIERLRAVRRLIADGMATGDAVLTVKAAPAPASTPPVLVLASDADNFAHRLATAATNLDGPTASALLREQVARRGVIATWDDVLRPVLAAIGVQWPEMSHGIAVEHLLSHIATVVLGEIVPAAADGTGNPGSLNNGHNGNNGHNRNKGNTPDLTGPTVLLACAPGELHDLPLVALSAALAARGVTPILLGARTPTHTLIETAELHPTAVVVLFSLLTDWAHIDVLEDLAPGTPLLAAGPGWAPDRLPGTVQHVNDLTGATAAISALI